MTFCTHDPGLLLFATSDATRDPNTEIGDMAFALLWLSPVVIASFLLLVH